MCKGNYKKNVNSVFDSVLDETQNGSGKWRICVVCICVISQLTHWQGM
jgi:hypothetical protein